MSDTESDTDTVLDSTSRLAKREPLEREVSLSVDSEEGRSRASSETSVGSRRVKAERVEDHKNAQDWGAEDDYDDEQGYEMDMDEDD